MDYGNAIQGARSTNATTFNNSSPNQVAPTNNGFSSDIFFQLLAAQLQFQDPFETVDNTQMVLQMAQFATLEALTTLNNQFGVFMEMSTIQDGAALVGKEVRIAVDGDRTIVGTVESVGFTSQGSIVKVNGEYFPVWHIIEIGSQGSLGQAETA